MTLPSVVLLDDVTYVFDLFFPREVPFLQGLYCLVYDVTGDFKAVKMTWRECLIDLSRSLKEKEFQ